MGADRNPPDGGGRSAVGWAIDWVVLEGARSIVAAMTVAVLFAGFVTISASRLSPLAELQPLSNVFGGLIAGNLTVITVVVTINQLLLSQELKPPDELRSQVDGVMAYREDVETSAGRIVPVEPLGFLRLVFENTRQNAQRLGGIARTDTGGDVADEIDRVVKELTRRIDRVDALMDGSDTSTFGVLRTTLDTNYASELNRLRRIEFRHGDQLSPAVEDCIDDLIADLQTIDIARQYFKGVYLQQELAALSRFLLFTGLPAVAAVTAAAFLFTAPGGVAVAGPIRAVLVSAIVTVGFVPLVVLFAFIIRTATVAGRTAAIIPFTTPSQERLDDRP